MEDTQEVSVFVVAITRLQANPSVIINVATPSMPCPHYSEKSVHIYLRKLSATLKLLFNSP